MKLTSLFKPDDSPAAKTALDRADRLLADSFRLLGQLCVKLADLVEAQRLARQGYDEQGKYLQRVQGSQPSEEPPAKREK